MAERKIVKSYTLTPTTISRVAERAAAEGISASALVEAYVLAGLDRSPRHDDELVERVMQIVMRRLAAR